MKNLAAAILLVFSQVILFGQCPPGDLIISSQQEIDEFATFYPNCTEFDGSITLTGGGIMNLYGLSNLTSIGGSLNLLYTSTLTNLTGLSNLTTVGGNVMINENYVLSNLGGLNELMTIGGDLIIDLNGNLTSMTALNKLTSIGGAVYILSNGKLNNIGLNSLSSVGQSFFLEENPMLESISGLSSLTYIGGSLSIRFNELLANLDGLEQLGEIDGSFVLQANESLSNISGLQGVESILGELYIKSNYALTSLDGLDNINPESIFDLTIYSNTSLSTCEVLSICLYLANPNGTITITNNGSGCDSQSEVEQACEWVSVEEPELSEQLSIYPNPASSVVRIELQNRPVQHTQLTISNLSGQEVISQVLTEANTDLDIQYLQAGVYILKLHTDQFLISRKLIVY